MNRTVTSLSTICLPGRMPNPSVFFTNRALCFRKCSESQTSKLRMLAENTVVWYIILTMLEAICLISTLFLSFQGYRYHLGKASGLDLDPEVYSSCEF